MEEKDYLYCVHVTDWQIRKAELDFNKSNYLPKDSRSRAKKESIKDVPLDYTESAYGK